MRAPLSALTAFVLTLVMLTPAVPARAEAQTGDTIIVVDASGSMWGQVEGEAKIEIARRVFADLLGDWPAAQRLGVIAYGHRRKGDCTDIEQIIDVGPVDAAGALERINALKPKGRTPLTDAVEQAAEALRYKDVPATVILLTDGIETCDRDPCQLAETLERSGVAFTAHVVGFDVAKEDQPKIACIAERTGGRFLSADSADQLDLAMRSVTIEPEPEPEPAPPATAEIELVAVDADTGEALPAAQWRLTRVVDGTEAGSGSGSTLMLELAAGSYRVSVRVPGAEANETIRVRGGHADSHRIEVQLPLPEASLKAPAEIPAGSQIEVHWTGPDSKNDYIAIVEAGAPEGTHLKYGYTRHGSPVQLLTPDALGAYEVRYVLGHSKRTLASAPVKLVAVSATVEGPAEAPAGSEIEIHWTGPDNQHDYITIVEAGAPEGTHLKYGYTRHGSPVKLQTPDALGAYEVRYVVGQSKRTLASAPVTLTAVEATLEAPAEAPAGSEIEVHWTGPDNQNDYITIVEAGAPEGTHTKYQYTRHGSPVKLQTPDALGTYELRYVVGQSKRTLATAPVTLTAVQATLEGPAEAPAGSKIEVHWTGPDTKSDYITIVEQGAPEGTYTKYTYTRHGSPVKLQTPDALGAHELRYVVGQSKRTLASAPINLVAVSATLEVPAEAPAGSEIDVYWTGPDNQGDYITIVEQGAPEGSYKKYRNTRQGSPAKLQVPDALGAYEVRYVVGQSKRTLASHPITLVPVSADLIVEGPVVPGAKVRVQWQGPNNPGDYITIVPAGAREGTYKKYRNTKTGSPAEIEAPTEPGDYEVRYVVGQSKRTLTSLPLKVEPPKVGLSVAGDVHAGDVVEVSFEGPGRFQDMIEIVQAGAGRDTKAIRSARASQGSPVKLFAPPSPGEYELRYRMSDTGEVAASIPLIVE